MGLVEESSNLGGGGIKRNYDIIFAVGRELQFLETVSKLMYIMLIHYSLMYNLHVYVSQYKFYE